jgi:hypothetical protein
VSLFSAILFSNNWLRRLQAVRVIICSAVDEINRLDGEFTLYIFADFVKISMQGSDAKSKILKIEPTKNWLYLTEVFIYLIKMFIYRSERERWYQNLGAKYVQQ